MQDKSSAGICFLLGLVLSLSACSIIGGSPVQITPTPVPTASIAGLRVIEPHICQVASQEMIRTNQPQGDLVAWSPVTNTVAFIGKTQESTWNVGELDLLSAPAFDTPKKLVVQAAGELSWSPEGQTLAYLSLRRSDNLYTIGLVNPDGRNSRDLFPDEAARTDTYSSQKAIIGWLNEGRLQVLTSCGLDCMQQVNFGILTGLSTSVGDPIQRQWDLWAVTNNHRTVVPPSLADLPGQLNWSPDGNSAIYLDENGNVWIVDVEAGSQYPVDFGFYGTAEETDWSFDGQYISIRIDNYLRIYAFSCP